MLGINSVVNIEINKCVNKDIIEQTKRTLSFSEYIGKEIKINEIERIILQDLVMQFSLINAVKCVFSNDIPSYKICSIKIVNDPSARKISFKLDIFSNIEKEALSTDNEVSHEPFSIPIPTSPSSPTVANTAYKRILRCCLSTGRFIATSIAMIESNISFLPENLQHTLRAHKFLAYSCITIGSGLLSYVSEKYNYDQLLASTSTSTAMLCLPLCMFLPGTSFKAYLGDVKTLCKIFSTAAAIELTAITGLNIIYKKEISSDLTTGYYLGLSK